MKASTLFRPAFGLLIIPFLVSCLNLLPEQVDAQDSGYEEPYEASYSREELAQMLAPIALYPDALLSQVLMASTYPIEVVEADRWVRKNPGLRGEDLDAALLDMDWDPSVKAMCHFPSILSLMSERLTETTRIGNAFLAQEAEVMDMVQELRAKAYAQNHLITNAQQRVIVKDETIVIEPADPKVIYVSYYDPMYVYGPWWYPAYPPYYWGPPGVRIGVGISYWPGFFFGFAFGSWSHFDWHHHYIHMDVDRRPRFVRHDRWIESPGRWHHIPHHRRGVVYHNESTDRRYGQYPQRPRDFQRDTHGVPQQQDPYRDRHRDDRNRIDNSNQHRDEGPRIDRHRQDRERVDRGKQEQQQMDRYRQDRERINRGNEQEPQPSIDRGRQEREQVGRHRQEQQLNHYRQERERERVDRGKQSQQQPQQLQPQQQQLQKQQQPQQQQLQKQQQQMVDRFRQDRERVERSKQQHPPPTQQQPQQPQHQQLQQQQQQQESQPINRGKQQEPQPVQERVEREPQQQQKRSDKVLIQRGGGGTEGQSTEQGGAIGQNPSGDSHGRGHWKGNDGGHNRR